MTLKYFRNSEWAVTRQGMECLVSSYSIPADTLGNVRESGDDDGLPDWPLHIVEKEWTTIWLFLEAFKHALETHKNSYTENFRPDWRERLQKRLEHEEAKKNFFEQERNKHPRYKVFEFGEIESISDGVKAKLEQRQTELPPRKSDPDHS
jgi:hypothetical protein